MEPAAALRRIAFYLERADEPTYRVRAFRTAARAVDSRSPAEIRQRSESGRLTELPGIGKTTARVVDQAVAGAEPDYLTKLAADAGITAPAGQALRQALRGDCHVHSDWSDGGSPIEDMAATALELGHDWMVLTDHSPRLSIARGLSAERLREQLDVVADLNKRLAPFRILTGIEVDILADGSLDQEDALLAELDVVVASSHSALRMGRSEMTQRMCTAVAHPHVDVLGHCTGRLITGRGRPPSEFDAGEVFTACRDHGVAVEINSRPDRLDPPRTLLRVAEQLGCQFTIDSDAHAPGQLDWLANGCERAEEIGISADRIINTRTADGIRDWTQR